MYERWNRFASIKIGGLIVGALALVKSFGDILNPENGKIIAGTLNNEKNHFVNTNRLLTNNAPSRNSSFVQNTTLGVVATNANLCKAEAKRLSMSAIDSLTRCISPSHTVYDGYVIFSIATGQTEANFNYLNTLGTQVRALVVQRAIVEASSLFGIPSYKDLKKEKRI